MFESNGVRDLLLLLSFTFISSYGGLLLTENISFALNGRGAKEDRALFYFPNTTFYLETGLTPKLN
jgi:hypothetical protein